MVQVLGSVEDERDALVFQCFTSPNYAIDSL